MRYWEAACAMVCFAAMGVSLTPLLRRVIVMVMRGLWIDVVDDSTLIVVEASGGPFIIPHTARERRARVS